RAIGWNWLRARGSRPSTAMRVPAAARRSTPSSAPCFSTAFPTGTARGRNTGCTASRSGEAPGHRISMKSVIPAAGRALLDYYESAHYDCDLEPHTSEADSGRHMSDRQGESESSTLFLRFVRRNHG